MAARSGGNRPDHARPSTSSSSTGTTTPNPRPERTSIAFFEQRRLRNVCSIALRNITFPDAENSSGPSSLRPYPTRSGSTLSSTSTLTLRRSLSNRTTRPHSRRRASSVASGHARLNDSNNDENDNMATREPSAFPFWDAASVRSAIDGQFAQSFVSLDRRLDHKVICRTGVSETFGVHCNWGDLPDAGKALEMPEGIADTDFIVSIWARKRGQEAEPSVFQGNVEPGREASLGFQRISQFEVDLCALKPQNESVLENTPKFPNTVILGLAPSLARFGRLMDSGDQGTAKVTKTSSKTQYYVMHANMPTQQDSLDNQDFSAQRADERAAVKSGNAAVSYEVDGILRLLQVQSQLRNMFEEYDRVMDRARQTLTDEEGPIAKDARLSEKLQRLRSARKQHDDLQEVVKVNMNSITARREALQRRRARLDIAKRFMHIKRTEYDEIRKKMTQLERVRHSTQDRVYARRVTLLRKLEVIYPIELVNAAQLMFSIVEIPLSNRDTHDNTAAMAAAKRRDHHDHRQYIGGLDQRDEEVVASALCMIAQMVTLIAHYMEIPLHYPIATAGNRSVIQDAISVMSGPRAFPLFAKGVERYRFEYAYFLLNKDIEQLMNFAGITILDIRNTLPNLKNLIVTVTASLQASARHTRRNLVGTETISLPVTPSNDEIGDKHSQQQQITADNTKKSELEPVGVGKVLLDPALASASEISLKKRASRLTTTSQWGMSLLGWGDVRATQTASAAARELQKNREAATSSPPPLPNQAVPTVRTLGGRTR